MINPKYDSERAFCIGLSLGAVFGPVIMLLMMYSLGARWIIP